MGDLNYDASQRTKEQLTGGVSSLREMLCICDSGFGDRYLRLSGVFHLKVYQAPDTVLATEWSKQ